MREKSQNNRRYHQAPAHKVTVAMTVQLPAVACKGIINFLYFGHKESEIS